MKLPSMDELFTELEKSRPAFGSSMLTDDMKIILVRAREKTPPVSFPKIRDFFRDKFKIEVSQETLASYYNRNRNQLITEYGEKAGI